MTVACGGMGVHVTVACGGMGVHVTGMWWNGSACDCVWTCNLLSTGVRT